MFLTLSLPCMAPAELENHLGVSDKTLSEFVIEMADGKDSAPAFRKALAEQGAELPESLAETLFSLIKRMKSGPACESLSTKRLPLPGPSLLTAGGVPNPSQWPARTLPS